MKVYKNLSIIGILSGGFAYSKTSTTQIEQYIINSFVNIRFGFVFKFKECTVSGKNNGNIFNLGDWTFMISRKL